VGSSIALLRHGFNAAVSHATWISRPHRRADLFRKGEVALLIA
jgi:hypothetical protein